MSGGANGDFRSGNDCNQSRCTTPGGTDRMTGSTREPTRHSMCTSDARRHRDSIECELATSCVSQIKLDARRSLDSTTNHGDTYQTLSSPVFFCWLRWAFRVPGPGVRSEANTRGILSGKWLQCFAWLAVPILVMR